MATSPPRRRPGALALLAAGLAVLAVATAVLFVAPPWATAPPRAPDTDAIVVLSGGEQTRLEAGLDLAARHPGATLALSSQDAEADPACTPSGRECFEAAPFSTRGEARAVGALASEHDWDSVAVVTSTYHLTRGRLLVGQCHDGRIVMVDAGNGGRSGVALAQGIIREWVALAAGLTVERAC